MESFTDAVSRALAPRYRVERQIGQGGMATVFLARDTKHDRHVAIKVLSPEIAQAIGSERFLREIEVVAGLNHPSILPLHDSGDEDGVLYYVMPYIEGGSLRARIDRNGPLPERDAVQIARGIAGALGFAHRSGIVHRDVKPANILLNEGHALLADFGIAHLVEGGPAGLTATGLVLGTPAYESPEQVAGEAQIDGRTDIYSLGCVLYESLAGRPPFEASTIRALLSQHLLSRPPRLRTERPDVSPGVEAVVDTALQKEPTDRFQTGEEMAGALDLVRAGHETTAVPPELPARSERTRRWRFTAAAALTVAVTAAALWLSMRRATPEILPTADALYLVLPAETEGVSERDAALADGIVRHLRHHLDLWRSVRSVPTLAIAKPAEELRLARLPLPESQLEFDIDLARKLGANRLVYVEAMSEGDSAMATARRYEIDRAGVREDRLFQSTGTVGDLKRIAAQLALSLVDIPGESGDFDRLLNRSPSPDANIHFDSGWAALNGWRLAEAERHFRQAVAEDEEFALAHHYLATTLYWRTTADPELILNLQYDIERHSRRADEYGTADRLLEPERAHVNAFRSFWSGQYDRARSRYDSLIAMNPTDLQALVLRGAVEMADPQSMRATDGTVEPRRDLNLARAMFDSAAGLTGQPELGWGQLFTIDRQVLQGAYLNSANGFDPPGAEPRPPYELGEAAEVLWFVPVMTDGGFRWWPDPITGEQRAEARQGAAGLLSTTSAMLERLARVELDQPRHHRELTGLLLQMASLERCAADPARVDSLLREADTRFGRALAGLPGDTAAQDFVRLANLVLAVGDRDSALVLVERGLALLGDWRNPDRPAPPLAAANPFLAVGRADVAAAIVERVHETATRAVDYRTVGGQFEDLDTGPVHGSLLALQLFGIAGAEPAELERRLEALQRTWNGLGYSDRQRVALRVGALVDVSPALVRLPAARAAWFDGWDAYGEEIPPVWKGILAAEADPVAADRWLDSTFAQLANETAPLDLQRPEFRQLHITGADLHLPLVLASGIGADSEEAVLLDRLSGCALSLRVDDPGWAVRWRWLHAAEE